MISIIIPTLNEEKIIGETLAPFAKMSLPHEVIVSDGGSKDRTAEIARERGARVFVHDNSHRQTIAEGRNVGGNAAVGDILCFLDADCSFTNPDDFFKHVEEYFKNNPDVLAIAPSLKVLPQYATLVDRIITWAINTSFRFSTNVLKRGAAPGECQIVRRDLFLALHGYNETYITGEDVDFFWRLSQRGKVVFVPHFVVWHTGRRAHKVGWPRLLTTWFINTVSMTFRGRSVSKEWTPIR